MNTWWSDEVPNHRVAILTIAALLEGKRIDCPPLRTEVTFKQAPKAKRAKPGQVAPLVEVQRQEESDLEEGT